MTEKRLARGSLNYAQIGATEHGGSPAGYRRVASRTFLGEGAGVYRRVAAGILAWELQRRSGLRVRTESDVVVPGARVVSGFGIGPFRLNAPCEVVWVHRPVPGGGPQSAGFGYGSLPGHPVRGEESFEVEIDATGPGIPRRYAVQPAVQLVLRGGRRAGPGGAAARHFPIH